MNIHVGTFIFVYVSSLLYTLNQPPCVHVQRLTNEYDKRKIIIKKKREYSFRNDFHLSE